MSGYLQRLVNAAAGHGDAVHPRTGSIFSPRAQEAAAPLHGSQDDEHAALPPPQARPPVASPAGELNEPPSPVARESRPTPLFPTASEVPAARTLISPPLVRAAKSGDIDGVLHPDDRPWEPRGVGGDPSTDVRVVAPVVRETAGASPFFATPNRIPEPRTRSAEPTRVRSDRHSGQSERQAEWQADDIQIHIGRIEVIALPPPAPRAPKAPDRSVSLEAYLNRRDGRPR